MLELAWPAASAFHFQASGFALAAGRCTVAHGGRQVSREPLGSHPEAMTNAAILSRLFVAFARYSEGEISLPELQEALLVNGHSLDNPSRAWRDLVDQVEGKLDIIRFTIEESAQHAAVLEQFTRLEQTAERLGLAK